MRLALILMLSCAVTACGTSSSDSEKKPESKPPATAPAQWEGCRELKAKLSDAADVVFTPHAKLAKGGPVWTVRFLDLFVFVPQADYEVSKRADSGSVSTILKADGYTISFIKDPPLETQDDMFQIVGKGRTDEGTAATTRLFGKAPTLHDLALLGYQHTRADLTCAAERRDQEAGIAAALALKSTAGPGELVSVHRDRSGLDDIVYVRRTPEGWSWEAQISTSDASYLLTVRTSARTFLAFGPWTDESKVTAPPALQNLTD